MDVEWVNLKAAEIRALQGTDAIAIVPVGSIEQHGPHLPVQVDTLLVSEVARRAARRLAVEAPVIVLPTIWSGLAEHHMSLGGTLTLDLTTFFSLVRGIVRSAVRSGFRRILILNGHGGNITALNALTAELTTEMKVPIAVTTYWLLAEGEFAEILEQQSTVLHACEAETSMLLALRPDLVDMAKLAQYDPPRSWAGDSDALYVWRSVESWSPSGIAGVPSAASDKKGEKLLEAAAAALAARLRDRQLWERG
jgi:creatinine amidohydrolase